MLLHIKDDNILLLSVTLFVHVTEVCAVDLKVPTLLVPHVGVNMMLPDGICLIFFFSLNLRNFTEKNIYLEHIVKFSKSSSHKFGNANGKVTSATIIQPPCIYAF